MNTQEFVEKAKIIHGEKYDYSLTNYVNCSTKVKIICREHGEFDQLPYSFIRKKYHISCTKCSGTKTITTKDFIELANKLHKNKYNYSLSKYINNKTKIKIICKIHGIFEILAGSHIRSNDDKRSGCSKCRFEKKKWTQQKFIQKAQHVHGNRYDYSKSVYLLNHEKIEIICNKKNHGSFWQTPHSHVYAQSGCSFCGFESNSKKRTMSQKDFINRSLLIHKYKGYDYSLVYYTGGKNKIIIICPKHGKFKQTPHDHLSGNGCNLCKTSIGENKIRDILIDKQIDYFHNATFDNFLNPYTNKKLKFDFYLPKYNICIEFDGKQHFVPIKRFGGYKNFRLTKISDILKQMYCKKNNIQLLRIKYNENVENILNNILN